MAPKGAIFLYSKKSDVYFPLSLQGFDYREPISADPYLIQKLEYHAKGFLDRKQAEQIKHKAFIDAIYDLGAEVTIPLFFRKEPLGILFIGEKIMGEKFTVLDENVIRVVSNHLVKSLHNKKLLDDLDKKRKDLSLKLLEQQTLFDISVAISSMLDVEKLGEEILWRSVGVLNTSKGFILQEEKNSPILKVSSSFNWDTSKMLLSKKLKIFETINKSRKGIVFTSQFKSTIQKKLKEDHIIIAPIQTIKNNIGNFVSKII